MVKLLHSLAGGKLFSPSCSQFLFVRRCSVLFQRRERQRNAECLCGLGTDSCLLALSLQVARTINNMQQQIQQHQRQLAQALLMKQQPPPPHLSLHPSAGKSAMDSFSPHPQAPGLPDLQTKEQQSSPNTFAPYPLGECPPADPTQGAHLLHSHLNILLHSVTNTDINICIYIY